MLSSVGLPWAVTETTLLSGSSDPILAHPKARAPMWVTASSNVAAVIATGWVWNVKVTSAAQPPFWLVSRILVLSTDIVGYCVGWIGFRNLGFGGCGCATTLGVCGSGW